MCKKNLKYFPSYAKINIISVRITLYFSLVLHERMDAMCNKKSKYFPSYSKIDMISISKIIMFI